MTPRPTSLVDFLDLVKKSLGATDARILDEDEPPPAAEGALVCELPAGQLLAVSFADSSSSSDIARRRLEMLVRAFASTLSTPSVPPPSIRKADALHDALQSVVEKAGALDAIVIDAHSPVIWGRASGDTIHETDETGESEPDNVVRIDRQPTSEATRELLERSRSLGVRPFEALATDPDTMSKVPRDLCDRHHLVPLSSNGGTLLIAMADPTDLSAIYEVVMATGLDVEPCLANDRIIQFVLAWQHATDAKAASAAPATLSDEQRRERETLAHDVRNRYKRHFWMRRALETVRAMPSMATLHRGGHVSLNLVEDDFVCLARSFAGIYVLIMVFEGHLDEIRAKHTLSQALPAIESLVLALPPRDPPPALAGAKAMRRPVRR